MNDNYWPSQWAKACAREMQETIVSAAISVVGGNMFLSAPPPARHHNIIHQWNDATGLLVKPKDQGFITSTGRFVGREEALRIALASGQPMIDHPSRSEHKLFSEDLW